MIHEYLPEIALQVWPVAPQIKDGPGSPLAHLHLWDPLSIPDKHIVHMKTPVGGGTRRMHLFPASLKNGSQLVVIHPDNEDAEGRGRCYIELRDNKGWDAGMEISGNDLARQAVAVHTLADTATEGVFCCWYRGRILVPLETDSDLKVTGNPLVVRVIDDDLNMGYVEIAISTMSTTGIHLESIRNHEVVEMRDTKEMGTPCGDKLVRGTAITKSNYSYRVITYG